MQHITEVLKIIEGGVKNNSTQVLSYSRLLAEKLRKEGFDRESRNILKKIERMSNENFGTTGLGQNPPATVPVDRDSRLSLGDESYPSVSSIKVQLADDVEESINEFINFIDKASMLSDAGVGISPSMLIYGPPGCGKTKLAQYLAARLELPLITARCDTLISSYLGSTAKNIRNLFDHAASRPCVLFLDEFDAIAKARDDQYEIGELKRVVVGLLQNIDALPEETIIVAATNHENLLDPAIWRRFSYKTYVGLPGDVTRYKLFEQFLSSYKPEGIKVLVEVTEGVSGSVIEDACKAAVRDSVVNGRKKVDLDFLVIRLIKDQYREILRSDTSKEEKAVVLRLKNKKLFTISRISKLLNMSVGKVSKIVSQG